MVLRRRLPNALDRVLEEFPPYHKDIEGLVVESTYNWYWLVDGLIEAGFWVRLANTAAIVQYNGLNHADDDSDARFLATLPRLGSLPVGYIYPKEQRAIRDLLRKREQLIRQRTANPSSLQNIITRNRSQSSGANHVKKLTPELVEQEQILETQVRPYPEYQGLIDVSGIGTLLGLTIMLETRDIERFAKVDNDASYCRCVGSKRTSNGKTQGMW